MPLAGVLVQYVGWSSVFYIYGETDVCMHTTSIRKITTITLVTSVTRMKTM